MSPGYALLTSLLSCLPHIRTQHSAWDPKAALLVVHGHQLIKTLPLKGLWGKALRFEAFVQLMMGQTRSEHHLRTAQERRARQGASASP